MGGLSGTDGVGRRGTAAAVVLALAVAAGAAAPRAAAVEADGAASGRAAGPEAVFERRGQINAYVTRSAGDRVSTESVEFQPIPEMDVTVRAKRRSNLIIEFAAECRADVVDPTHQTAVMVEARVDGVRVPGPDPDNNIVLCGKKEVFVETHSYRWAFPVGAKSTRRVTIHYRFVAGPDGTQSGRAFINDRILTVLYEAP